MKDNNVKFQKYLNGIMLNNVPEIFAFLKYSSNYAKSSICIC